MLSFKSFQGLFLQRRINKFLRDNDKVGIKHEDVLSVAGIYFGELMWKLQLKVKDLRI